MVQFNFRALFTLLFVTSCVTSFAQEKKHNYEFYFHWGYNRSYYTDSDIHVKGGDDFDFTLHDVKAKDYPERFNTEAYFNPAKFTIPQFNFRVGITIDKKWSLSGGWDHLKYVVKREQLAAITGRIGAVGGFAAGDYSGDKVPLNYGFFQMEHTDGLNFIHANIDRYYTVFEKTWFKAQVDVGAGTGPVCPWTDTRLFGNFYRNPSIHFAGWGFSVNASPRFVLWNRFFFEHMFRVGHIQLWDIMIVRDKYTASQKINYFERNITAGFIFPLNARKNGNNSATGTSGN